MITFACPVCRSLVSFENSLCVTCGTALVLDRAQRAFRALGPDGPPLCARAGAVGCNWAAEARRGEHADLLCASCALTRAHPDPAAAAAEPWARTEQAKRRLLFQLDGLGLPVVGRDADPRHGLCFDLLDSSDGRVVTGHAAGVVTIDLAEGDDAHREALRVRLDEPYRTMLGHVRHEVGHWYWDVLVDAAGELESFRELFGDERRDYSAALEAHYDGPPQPDWQDRHVSAYAAAHPWEDWAETFAHYLHVRDTLQTASSFGVWVGGPDAPVRTSSQAPLAALADEHAADIDQLIATWLPLTYALNAINRSMGKDDLYPFILAPAVVDKLGYVHRLVTRQHRRQERATARG